MAQVPFTDLSGQAPAPGTIIPDAYNRTQADPNAFGAGIGRGVQQLGTGLEQAGDADLGILGAQAHMHNVAGTTQGLMAGGQTALNYLHGDATDPNNTGGFLALHGQDAINAAPATAQAIMKAFQDQRDALQNDAQREMFDRESRRQQQALLSAVDMHVAEERKTYFANTQQSAIQNGLRQAAVGYNDDGLWHTGVQAALDASMRMDAAAGASQDTMNAHQNAILGSAWQQRIVQTGEDNPSAALMMLEKNRGLLDTNTYATLNERLQEKSIKADGTALGRAAVQGAMGGAAPPAPSGPVPNLITAEAQRQGVDPSLALTTAKIETNMGAVPDRAGSQYQGVFQLGADERAANGATAAYGTDRGEQVRAGVSQLGKVQQAAAAALGRDPAPWEVYLTHQQGVAGGPALIKADPNTPAAQVLAPFYGNSTAAAARAITSNGGTADMTAGQFRGMWQQRYATAEQSVGGLVPTSGPQTPDGSPITLASTGGAPSAGGGLAPSPPSGPQYPDMDAIMDRINQIPDPRRRAVAASEAQHEVSMYAHSIANQQRAMTGMVEDTLAALGRGQQVDVPTSATIHSLYPPAQADQIVLKLNNAQDYSLIQQAVNTASPADLARYRADMASGTGVLPTMMKVRHGQIADPNAPQAPDDSTMGQAPAPIVGQDAGGPVAPGYRDRVRYQAMLETAIANRNKALQQDPAGFVAQNIPTVQQALAGAANGTVKPADYVAATLAAQAQLGVPPELRRGIPAQQAQALVRNIVGADPATQDVAKQLDGMAETYGPAWHQVFGDLVNTGLPPQYQVIATMTRPEQAVARDDLQRALQYAAKNGGMPKLREAVGAGGANSKAAQVDQAIDNDGTLGDFYTSTMDATDHGAALNSNVREAARALAYMRVLAGDDPAVAVQTATSSIIDKAYDFSGTMRVPKGQLGDMKAATASVLASLKPADLADIPGPDYMTPDERKAISLSAARNGRWSPNEDDSGLVLMGLYRNSGYKQMFRADGSRVEVKFNGAPVVSPAQANSAPAQPSAPPANGG